MCAINPKHKKTFGLRVYTSEDISEAAFEELVYNKVLEVEIALNADGRLRWHVHEVDDSCKKLIIVPDGWPCKLRECPPGLFVTDMQSER